MANNQASHHFLIVTHPIQSHINPARQLAHRLVSVIPSCNVTLSTAVSSHRKMFPSLSSPNEETMDRQVSFIPYSDGYDFGYDPSIHSMEDWIVKFPIEAQKSVVAIINRLATREFPVSGIIYTLFLPWIHDVARIYGLPTFHYWIQPATVLSIYYHYFHEFDAIFSSQMDGLDSTVSIPGLMPLKIRDLPSFIPTASEELSAVTLSMFRDIFEPLDRLTESINLKQKVLINTFEALEADAINAMRKHYELFAVGPFIQSSHNNDQEEKNIESSKHVGETKYMKWLDEMQEKSVVYISFGGLTVVSKPQLEEIQLGLKDSGLPYLWVVRTDSRVGLDLQEESSNGMILQWCDQVAVLSHPSIGCFLTHHGWNSTLESLMCGVPMVGIPQWSDQPTNAKLTEQIGVGIRCEASGVVVTRGEIKRCLEMVMKDGEMKMEMRRNAVSWKEKLMEAIERGGESETSLVSFVESIDKNPT